MCLSLWMMAFIPLPHLHGQTANATTDQTANPNTTTSQDKSTSTQTTTTQPTATEPASTQTPATRIELPEGTSLQVMLMDSIAFDSANIDAYFLATEGLEAARQAAQVEIPVTYRRFGERLPRGQPRLILHIYELTPSSARFLALLEQDGERINLGYFKEDSGTDLASQPQSGLSDRVRSLARAATPLWQRLPPLLTPTPSNSSESGP